jgi:AcrR family transcriptional regulator
MASSPSTSTRKREATCNAILEATGAFIAEKGIDGFTISEVARRGKINRALIYHYFQNRDNLVVQAIDHIIRRSEEGEADVSADSVERSVRMYIQHPEVARFFFQLLLTGRPLLRLGERITDTIAMLEQYQREHAPDSSHDIAFGLLVLVLAQMAWPFSRKEFARLLGVSVKEADKRFIAQLRWASDKAIQTMSSQPG